MKKRLDNFDLKLCYKKFLKSSNQTVCSTINTEIKFKAY